MMVLADSLVFTKVNTMLARLPMDVVCRFIRELRGFLSYICLIQGAIELFAEDQTITGDSVFFHGIPTGASDLRNVYCSMVVEVVVWSSFTRASRDIGRVLQDLVRGSDGILFELTMRSRDIFAAVETGDMFEVLIAAASLFKVDAVETIESGDAEGIIYPVVKMTCVGDWSVFDIERKPAISCS
jgi:hypothetical protein